jgi:hypothetical protein
MLYNYMLNLFSGIIIIIIIITIIITTESMRGV